MFVLINTAFIGAGDQSSSSGDKRVGEILGGEPSWEIKGEHRVERMLRKGILSFVYRIDTVNNSKCATKMAAHFAVLIIRSTGNDFFIYFAWRSIPMRS